MGCLRLYWRYVNDFLNLLKLCSFMIHYLLFACCFGRKNTRQKQWRCSSWSLPSLYGQWYLSFAQILPLRTLALDFCLNITIMFNLCSWLYQVRSDFCGYIYCLQGLILVWKWILAFECFFTRTGFLSYECVWLSFFYNLIILLKFSLSS